MARAVVVNAAQLASYSQSKQALIDSGECYRPSLISQHLFIFFIFGLFMPLFGQDSEVYDRKRGGEEVGRGLGNDIRPDLNLCSRGLAPP